MQALEVDFPAVDVGEALDDDGWLLPERSILLYNKRYRFFYNPLQTVGDPSTTQSCAEGHLLVNHPAIAITLQDGWQSDRTAFRTIFVQTAARLQILTSGHALARPGFLRTVGMFAATLGSGNYPPPGFE